MTKFHEHMQKINELSSHRQKKAYCSKNLKLL